MTVLARTVGAAPSPPMPSTNKHIMSWNVSICQSCIKTLIKKMITSPKTQRRPNSRARDKPHTMQQGQSLLKIQKDRQPLLTICRKHPLHARLNSNWSTSKSSKCSTQHNWGAATTKSLSMLFCRWQQHNNRIRAHTKVIMSQMRP